MKAKKVLLLAALLSAVVCRGQDTAVYQSFFGDSSTGWYVLITDYSYINGSTNYWQSLASDTAEIEGVTYNVLRVECFDFGGQDDSEGEPQYLRESADHSKLYLRANVHHQQYPEILLMDLNMEVGDTLATRDRKITVDSVFSRDGRKVLRTDLHIQKSWNHTDTLYFIEGMGPSFGPFYPYLYEYQTLTCFYKDDSLQYHRYRFYSDSSECILAWIGDGIKGLDGVESRVFPNPTRDVVNIQLGRNTSGTVVVTTSTGMSILAKTFTGESATVSLKDHPCGIYYLTVIADGYLQTTKIIKQ